MGSEEEGIKPPPPTPLGILVFVYTCELLLWAKAPVFPLPAFLQAQTLLPWTPGGEQTAAPTPGALSPR